MLNRRTLRVKAMQAMFAYKQCKEANYNVAIEKTTSIPPINIRKDVPPPPETVPVAILYLTFFDYHS